MALAATPSSSAREVAAPISAMGERYADAVRGRGVNVGVRYHALSDSTPEVDVDWQDQPPPSRSDQGSGGESRIELDPIVTVIALLVLGGVIFLFARYGGRLRVSFNQEPEAGTRPTVPSAAVDPDPQMQRPFDLAAIAGLADRRIALAHLVRLALTRAADANGRKIAPSQTSREVLRQLPPSWPQLPALRQLVLASEVVNFGGRPLSESVFQTCLAAAEKIIAARPAS